MGLSQHIHPDKMQMALLLLCALDLGFFMYYMIALNLGARNTISESLFTRPEYASFLTCTLFSRILGVVFYFVRYRKQCAWVVPGYIGIALTFAGWVWLVNHKDNTQHFLGVFVFCLGTTIYSIVLIRLCEESHPHLARVHFWLEFFLLLTSGALVLAFVIVWLHEEANNHHKSSDDPNQYAYIIEHCAYISFLLFYSGFFLFHTPDDAEKEFVNGVYQGEQDTVLRPLVAA
jgi:hypothetical protein